jgi:ribosomal protein L6P/L9E
VVESVNKKKELVTLRGPQGPVTVKAKYPDNLKVLKAGDTVVVRSSELLAARIKPVG